jgi:hypothetical protein
MGNAVYQLQVSVGRPLLEAEEADDAVDVDRQQRPEAVYQR